MGGKERKEKKCMEEQDRRGRDGRKRKEGYEGKKKEGMGIKGAVQRKKGTGKYGKEGKGRK